MTARTLGEIITSIVTLRDALYVGVHHARVDELRERIVTTTDVLNEIANALQIVVAHVTGQLAAFDSASYDSTRIVPGCWPEHMRKAVAAYLDDGKPMGGYLTALFEGDAFRAVCNADGQNYAAMVHCLKWIAQCAPTGAFGCPGKVEAWIGHGGLNGLDRCDACGVKVDGDGYETRDGFYCTVECYQSGKGTPRYG